MAARRRRHPLAEGAPLSRFDRPFDDTPTVETAGPAEKTREADAVPQAGESAPAPTSPPAPPAPQAPVGPPAPADAVLAEGLDVRITVADFEAKMAEQSPFARARYDTLERKKGLLDNLIRFKVLLAEARRQGLDRDPQVAATVEKVMVQLLVQRRFTANDARTVSEKSLREEYERRHDEYSRPAKVRVELHRLRARGEARGRDSAVAAASAERMRAHLAAGAPLKDGNSADPWFSDESAVDVRDTGFLTREELASKYGEPIASASFGLGQGQVSGVIETPEGLVVARLTARQEATQRTFEEVREQIAAKLSREVKTREFDAQVDRLRSQAGVRVDDRVLERVVVK